LSSSIVSIFDRASSSLNVKILRSLNITNRRILHEIVFVRQLIDLLSLLPLPTEILLSES
jgi:hypothetical protein